MKQEQYDSMAKANLSHSVEVMVKAKPAKKKEKPKSK